MNTRIIVPLLVALAVSACDDAVGTAGDLTPEEVAQLSDAVVGSTFESTTEVATDGTALVEGAQLLAESALTATTEFTHTRSCVLGGQVVVEGTRVREWDWEARTGFMELSLTRTHEACARPLRDDDEAATTITLTGAPDIAVEAYHEWAMGERRGVQTLSMEGAVDWVTDDGRSGTCTIDIEAGFDPDSWTRTVQGTFCGREIDRTTTWSQEHHMGGRRGMGG